jgi:hypothetical protein
MRYRSPRYNRTRVQVLRATLVQDILGLLVVFALLIPVLW